MFAKRLGGADLTRDRTRMLPLAYVYLLLVHHRRSLFHLVRSNQPWVAWKKSLWAIRLLDVQSKCRWICVCDVLWCTIKRYIVLYCDLIKNSINFINYLSNIPKRFPTHYENICRCQIQRSLRQTQHQTNHPSMFNFHILPPSTIHCR